MGFGGPLSGGGLPNVEAILEVAPLATLVNISDDSDLEEYTSETVTAHLRISQSRSAFNPRGTSSWGILIVFLPLKVRLPVLVFVHFSETPKMFTQVPPLGVLPGEGLP